MSLISGSVIVLVPVVIIKWLHFSFTPIMVLYKDVELVSAYIVGILFLC